MMNSKTLKPAGIFFLVLAFITTQMQGVALADSGTVVIYTDGGSTLTTGDVRINDGADGTENVMVFYSGNAQTQQSLVIDGSNSSISVGNAGAVVPAGSIYVAGDNGTSAISLTGTDGTLGVGGMGSAENGAINISSATVAC